MARMTDIKSSGIYSDLMRKFRDNGHSVYIISPVERRFNTPTYINEVDGAKILCVRTLNVQKINVIEKGLGQVLLELLFKRAIGKYFRGVKFDLILYSTPPITFVNAIKFVRKQNPGAMTYLLLKDIFPQNAVDLGMLSKGGLKGVLYRSFRRKEKELYRISDWIGCMSPANAKYVIEHNPEVNLAKVEVCPNSCDVPSDDFVQTQTDAKPSAIGSLLTDCRGAKEEKTRSGLMIRGCTNIRQKYGLPAEKPVFLYGGNLGKPQGISFLIECLKANAHRKDCRFVIVGNGVDYPKLEKWVKEEKPESVSLFQFLPKAEYDQLAEACDIGLIFLDYRFTIPNYPSRLLSYLTQKKPIIACTDPVCDTGTIAEANGYGFWCLSNSVEAFTKAVDKMLASDIRQMGENGYRFFLENYTVQNTYDTIMKHFVSTPF